MTNIPDYNPTSDAIQLRPFEILCQVGFSGQATIPGFSKCLTANAAASDSAALSYIRHSSCAAHALHCQSISIEQTPNPKPLEYNHRRCGPSCGRRASAHPRLPPGRGFLMSIRRVRICDPSVTQSPPCAKGRTMETCKVTGLPCCDMMHSVPDMQHAARLSSARACVPLQRFSAANRAIALYPYVLNVYNNPAYAQVRLTAMHFTIKACSGCIVRVASRLLVSNLDVLSACLCCVCYQSCRNMWSGLTRGCTAITDPHEGLRHAPEDVLHTGGEPDVLVCVLKPAGPGLD